LDIVAYNQQLRQEYEKTGNIKLLGKYVMSETIAPIADFPNAIKIIRENYSYHTDTTLLSIGAYLASGWTSGDNELLDILNKMYIYLPKKEKSIISLLNAHHLSFIDKKYMANPEYERYLLQSIENDDTSVKNKVRIAKLYSKDKAKKLYQEAIRNVIEIHSMDYIENLTLEQMVQPQAFINEFIVGTHIPYVHYDSLVEEMELL
jgi:hypothetical protein